jgi:hypothetical protein
VADIINKLGDGNYLKQIDEKIIFEDIKAGIIKWKERTTTSPSGRHLGHYKLLTRLDIKDEEDESINLSNELLRV